MNSHLFPNERILYFSELSPHLEGAYFQSDSFLLLFVITPVCAYTFPVYPINPPDPNEASKTTVTSFPSSGKSGVVVTSWALAVKIPPKTINNKK